MHYSIDYKLVESVGDFVFKELIAKLNSPTDISYELPKLGTWNIRENKFMRSYRCTPMNYRSQWNTLLENMQKYRELKKYKRELRFQNVTKQECSKTSEDKPEEHSLFYTGED